MEVVEKEEGLAKWRGRSQGSLGGGPGLASKAPLGRCEGRALQAEDKKSLLSRLYLGEMSLDLKKVQEMVKKGGGVSKAAVLWNTREWEVEVSRSDQQSPL